MKRSRTSIFAALFILSLVTFTEGESVKNYTKTFKVSSEGAMLSISNQSGSIKVKSWERPEIRVSAVMTSSSVEIKDKQIENSVYIDAYSSKAADVDFEVTTPYNSSLELKCLNGPIEVSSVEGRILAQTTEGEIVLTELTSPNVTAKSVTGPISYQGVLKQKGIYTFHSVENNVDITISANSKFCLMAAATMGKIDLGGFQLQDTASKRNWIAGKFAGGGASLNLSTHRGSIRLHKERK